jgi:hypothetical protein
MRTTSRTRAETTAVITHPCVINSSARAETALTYTPLP